MRWMVMKKAWRLAKEAFPGKEPWVRVPYRMLPAGEMEVYDVASQSLIGSISYKTMAKSGKTVISMAVNDSSAEVNVPYVRPKQFKVHAIAAEPIIIGMPPHALVEASRPKFKRNERARVQDGSMDHGELCTILDTLDSDDGQAYLVLVDGSSKPIQILEDNLARNMAGVIPK